VSQENLERLRTALDGFNREGPKAIIALLDPDVEWIADRSDMGQVTYRGQEGVRRSFEELYEGFENVGFEVDELIDAGDRTVALGQMSARGRSTGLYMKMPLTIVCTVGRDGKLVRYESFRDRQAALKAVGLEE